MNRLNSADFPVFRLLIAAFIVLGIVILAVLAGTSLSDSYKAATIAEIQTVTAQSNCAKKMLSDANRNAIEILRRDLKSVQAICVSIDEQAKAFNEN
ncbi:hypothetical protein [Pseudomonas sp. R9.37]|uniref:hypothetical protein n=1 Tax=Pseudomonas sp. R9.37 TaxID=1390498 RepID=UPI0011B1C6FE|nr:hypothetical protein [Pseudomonas sp. R9.37]